LNATYNKKYRHTQEYSLYLTVLLMEFWDSLSNNKKLVISIMMGIIRKIIIVL